MDKVVNHGTTGNTISFYEYTLNKAGIRTAVVEANGDSVLYTYDDLYRLTSERRTGLRSYEISYTYDAVGNRLTKTKRTLSEAEVTTTYVYNNRDQLEREITDLNTWNYQYDKSGRMLSKYNGEGSTFYNWTDNDRLRQLITPDTVINYEYDFSGVKVKEGDKILLVDHSQRYAQVIGEIEGTDTVSYTFGLERISQSRGGVVHYYHADGQGSIRQLTNAAGTVTDEYGYYAFGETLFETGTTENSFRYTGESYDPNSGFYYLRARWMSPTHGRFVSVDPYAGDPMAPVSLHRYLYANQSPVSMSDPSGNITLMEFTTTTVIVGILASLAQTSIGWTLHDKIYRYNKPVEWTGTGYLGQLEAARIANPLKALEWGDLFSMAPSPTASVLILDLKSEILGDEEAWVQVVVPAIGLSGFGPAAAGTWFDATVFTPSALGISRWAFFGSLTWGAVGGAIGQGWSNTLFNVGFGVGEATFAGAGLNGFDYGYDLFTGIAIPVGWHKHYHINVER